MKNIFLFSHTACLFIFLVSPPLFAQEISINDFLKQHWQRPLPPQGDAPLALTTLESELNPKNCGTCHRRQFADWRKSLHSQAMTSGLLGQLQDMPADDLAQQQACIRCHAPLHQQASDTSEYIKNSEDKGQEQHGVMCAACHVRNYQWFGPPSNKKLPEHLPHQGFQTHSAFEDSKFCAACHQFKDNEYSLNGKLLENTYKEWQASPYAKKDVHCQNCHMPKRRHIWKGIHDKKTTRDGITINIEAVNFDKNSIKTTLSVTNTGVGHAFPTYVTPKITVQIVQLDEKGQPLIDTQQQQYIMRDVTLNVRKELSDTRLLPDESMRLDYQQPKHPQAQSLSYKIIVAPDYFYARFYQAILTNGTAKKGKAHIQNALKNAKSSVYTLYEKTVKLP